MRQFTGDDYRFHSEREQEKMLKRKTLKVGFFPLDQEDSHKSAVTPLKTPEPEPAQKATVEIFLDAMGRAT